MTGILASIRNAKAKKRIQAHDADRIDVLFHALAPGYPKEKPMAKLYRLTITCRMDGEYQSFEFKAKAGSAQAAEARARRELEAIKSVSDVSVTSKEIK